jgi:hypothetical protein
MRASDLSRATWRKSSYSNGTGGSCVEVAVLTAEDEHDIAVRDSKDPHGPALTFTAPSGVTSPPPSKPTNSTSPNPGPDQITAAPQDRTDVA